jgi:hypothetical protein
LIRVPKILQMPGPAKRNSEDKRATPKRPAELIQLSTDRDEETASIAKISKWLELADAALVITPHRKRAA